MKDVSLNVIHPLTGKTLLVETVDSITIEEFILKLVECCVLQEGDAYSLAIKKDEDTIACDPAKKLEDYQVSDGNILMLEARNEVWADGAQEPEKKKKKEKKKEKKENLAAAADLEQDGLFAAAALQRDDFIATGNPGEPRIKIHSHIGIPTDQIPQLDLSKWLNNMKDTPSFDSLIMLLHDYRSSLEENEENRKLQKNEYMKIRDEREKLKNKVSEYEKILDEKRVGTIMMAVSNVIIGVGTAFLTTNPLTAIFTIAAGLVSTGLGLWLSLKKGS